ncbi:MAG: VWA domain-containing protein [Kofleriaceae bacterium]|nr:VWA domain-containing protein [Kofleriaceae bacterium]
MKLATFAILVTASRASAETTLREYGPNVPPRPTAQASETSCELAVQLRGAVATVEVRQRIMNDARRTPLAVSYEFDLPPGASITSFEARGSRALPVPATFKSVGIDERPMFGADPAVLVARPEGSSSQYAIRVQPVDNTKPIELVTRYSVLAEVRASALRLVLPGRDSKLTGCRGTLRATGGPGTTVGSIAIDGVAERGAAASFVVTDKPVTLDASLMFAGSEPVAWSQTEALADGWNATALTVVAPHVRAQLQNMRRALFVVDGSRSMDLVGRKRVITVVRAIAAGLPAGTPVDAIVFDRSAARVLGTWKPSSPETVAAIDTALRARGTTNGTDITKAFELARTTLDDGGRDATLVIVISDGVLGGADGKKLVDAFAGKTNSVDVLGVVLDPASTRSPGADALRSPVIRHGGAFVEIDAEHVDAAIEVVDGWLRPSWLELASAGGISVPDSVRSGGGFTQLIVHRGAPSKFVLTAKGASKLRLVPRAVPGAGVATLALASPAVAADVEPLRARALARHPYVHDHLAFAVLTTEGKVARDRSSMVKGGGPYERVTAVDDPDETPPYIGKPMVHAQAIERETLERLFREQLQPRAYACYQRALATQPKLAGTVHFTFHMGRGEVSEVMLVGLGDPQLDACLTDAAYALSVPFPDFAINADDQTLARYPLSFQVADKKPIVVLGDADSSSPIDVENTPGELPESARSKVRVNAATPLGNLKPSSP